LFENITARLKPDFLKELNYKKNIIVYLQSQYKIYENQQTISNKKKSLAEGKNHPGGAHIFR
jgi:hypothetical protein